MAGMTGGHLEPGSGPSPSRPGDGSGHLPFNLAIRIGQLARGPLGRPEDSELVRGGDSSPKRAPEPTNTSGPGLVLLREQ